MQPALSEIQEQILQSIREVVCVQTDRAVKKRSNQTTSSRCHQGGSRLAACIALGLSISSTASTQTTVSFVFLKMSYFRITDTSSEKSSAEERTMHLSKVTVKAFCLEEAVGTPPHKIF